MNIGVDPELKGMRCGVIFFKTDSYLDECDRYDLILDSVEMYLDKIKERHVGGDNYDGTIRNTNKRVSLGCFSGDKFKVELETTWGRASLEFIVIEPMNNPELN